MLGHPIGIDWPRRVLSVVRGKSSETMAGGGWLELAKIQASCALSHHSLANIHAKIKVIAGYLAAQLVSGDGRPRQDE
jgi:hypothetical protein